MSRMLGRKLTQDGWLVPIVCLLAAGLYFGGVLTSFQTWLSDQRFRVGSRAASGEVVLVDIDAKSLGGIGVWPWPRAVHGAITDRLRQAQARVIGFDIDFSSKSDPDNDAAFAEALARAGGMVLLATFDQQLTSNASNILFSNRPHPDLAKNSFPGHVNVISDARGVVRAVSLLQKQNGDLVPSMSAMLAGRTRDLSDTVTIDYSIDPATVDRISVVDLLEGKVDPARIAGRAALVGASALELRDVFQTPAFGLLSGPMIQVLAAETIAQDRQIIPSPPRWIVLALAVLGIGFVLAWRRCDWRVLLLAMAVSSVAIELAGAALQVSSAISLHSAPLQVALAGLCMSAVVREIYHRRILLAASRRKEQHTRLILDRVVADNYAGVIVVDEDRLVRAMSRHASTLLGCGDLTARPLSDGAPAEINALVDRAFAGANANADSVRTLAGEVEHSAHDGRRLLEYTLTLSPFVGSAGQAAKLIACLTFRDVTEERGAQERLAYLARNDVLTALPNRHAFEERLAESLAEDDEHVAVLFFDLDRFKTINDTLGHLLGDGLLCAVAQRVEAMVKDRGAASRFGGDEFAVLLNDVKQPEARAFCAELIERLSQPFVLDNHRLVVGVSVGCAFADGTSSGPGLIKNADTALYRAKAAGGNKFIVFETSMDAPLRARQAMELDLWQAFDDWQFELVYQPQVDIASEKIIGAEVLLRWRHPTLGYISPAEFIPVAEAVGLIEQLGAKVLRQACVEAARWPSDVKVSVNVSASQFVRGDLLKEVKEALSQSGLPAERLDLEITESLFIHDAEIIEKTMQELRALGVSFSIDDFGTGYSSLSYVRQFPVDKIKIDKSFICGLPADQDSVAIVSAVVAMARSLGLRVNAEGVETNLQADALRMLGCDEGQGWLFGRPQTPDQFLALLSSAGLPSLAQAG